MRYSLHFKILVGYILLTLMVAGAVYIYLNTSFRTDISQHTQKQLLKDTRLIQAYLEHNSPLSFSPNIIDPIADHLAKQSGARVTIISNIGTVVGDTGFKRFLKLISLSLFDRLSPITLCGFLICLLLKLHL